MVGPKDLRVEADVECMAGHAAQGYAIDRCADTWETNIRERDEVRAKLAEVRLEIAAADEAMALVKMDRDVAEYKLAEARAIAGELARYILAKDDFGGLDNCVCSACVAYCAIRPGVRKWLER